MRIEKQWIDGVLVMSVRGKLNTERRANTLRQTVDDVVAQEFRNLVLDFERTRRVDQSGLDTLAHCLQTVRRAGGELKLAAISRRLSALFTTSGLLRVFDVYDSVADAVDAFERAEGRAPPTAAIRRWRYAAAPYAHLVEADSVPLGYSSLTLRALPVEQLEVERERKRHRDGVEAELVVAGLVVERAGQCQGVELRQRFLRLPRGVNDRLL